MDVNFNSVALANEIAGEYCKDVREKDCLEPDFKALLIELNDRCALHQIVLSVCCHVWLRLNPMDEEVK